MSYPLKTNYKNGDDVTIGDTVSIIAHPDFLGNSHIGRTGVIVDQWNAWHKKHWRVDIDNIERVLCFDWHELYKIEL